MAYLLASYFLLLLVYIGYSAAGIYHLRRFGYAGDLTRSAIFVYIGLSLAVIAVSLILISFRPWPVDFNL